ncbi:hypothetical protein AEMCBJ_04305 [Cupriavidus necator]|uniref:hypothetical protein n=1 Tax=Cupriavidus necator TaxID=106590 RepID=UPI003F732618
MPTTIYCQFEDESEQGIITIFGAPQDQDAWPNQGSLPSDDLRYVEYYDAQLSWVQQWLVKPGD